MYSTLKERFVALLRWTERYTKTDMVYLTKGSFWIAVGQVVYVPTALLLSVAFANLVPKDVYGTYRFILSLASIVGVFALTGVDTAIPQAVARGYEGAVRQGFRTYLKWSWMMIAAGGVLAAYYLFHGNTTIGYAILIAGVTLPVFSGASLYSEFLIGRREFRVNALLSIFQTLFPAVIMLATMLLVPDTLALITAYFVGTMVSALLLYFFVIRRYHPNARIDPESTRFGFHVSFANFLAVTADQLDRLLVFHFFGAAQLAEYSFAIAIPEYLRSATKAVNTLATPKYAVRERVSFRHTILQKTFLLVGGLAIVALAYALSAPFIFRVFYPHYLASIPYSQVYALAILGGGTMLSNAALTAQRAVREQYLTVTANNTVRIVLLIVLTLYFGLWGTIVARILGKLSAVVVNVSFARSMGVKDN
ncbi:MAG TPA: oligosaccharide flippase family protein [Candidatus Paceibacterota bacterium]|nr:oligosaccharide flippase family protein [Candidatus Paceibacterota bacterium]